MNGALISQWWSARSGRERTLLLALAGVCGLLLVLLGDRMLDAAEEDAQVALADARTLRADIDRLGARSGGGRAPVRPGEQLPTLLGRTAQAAGLTPSRIAPGRGGSVSVVFERADATATFTWLDQLHRRHGLVLSRVALERIGNSSDLRVEADVRHQNGTP